MIDNWFMFGCIIIISYVYYAKVIFLSSLDQIQKLFED